MGKINKLGKWVPYHLNEHQVEILKVAYIMLLRRHERKSVLYQIVMGDEKWIYFKNPKQKNRDFHLAKAVLQHQGQITLARRPCAVSDGTREVLYIMNYCNPAKPLMHNAIANK